jgi:hypothetical protein
MSDSDNDQLEFRHLKYIKAIAEEAALQRPPIGYTSHNPLSVPKSSNLKSSLRSIFSPENPSS